MYFKTSLWLQSKSRHCSLNPVNQTDIMLQQYIWWFAWYTIQYQIKYKDEGKVDSILVIDKYGNVFTLFSEA